MAEAIRSFLTQSPNVGADASLVQHAAFAIANPVDGDWIQMTNADWAFSIRELKQEFGFETLLLVNDFTALAMALPLLKPEQRQQVGGGVAQAHCPVGLLGAGTGLGVSGLIPRGDAWIALGSEGGHVSFAPANAREMEILRFAWRQHAHVSFERLLSGMGLMLIYQALCALEQKEFAALDAPEITRRALTKECPVCDETVELFCAMLGTVAGNLALTLGAKGGVYLGGGIVPRLGERFIQSGFRSRFEQKGRFSDYLAAIPTYIITAPHPALYGVSLLLEKELAGPG